MSLETIHPEHKIRLGLTVRDIAPTEVEIGILASELYTAIHDLPNCQIAETLSFRAIWIQLQLHGVEFNNDSLSCPDIFFNYTISKREVRLSTSVMFATRQPDYTNRFLQLRGEDNCPIDEFDSCEQAMCKVAAKTLLNTVWFLRSV